MNRKKHLDPVAPPAPRIKASQGAIWGFSFCLLFLGACSEDARSRSYTEIDPVKTPQQRGGDMSGSLMEGNPVDIKVTWTAPEEWADRDSSSALRIGSFLIPDPAAAVPVQHIDPSDTRNVDVSIVQLAGFAGGLEDNVIRWMKQVNIILPDDDQLKAFLEGAESFKTRSGQSGIYIDLTPKLSGNITETSSIFGAVIATDKYTVFVKAQGDKSRVIEEISALKAFCETLSIEDPDA